MNIRPYRGIYPSIHPTAYIDPDARVIGEVSIGEDASMWPFVVARGDVNTITIGARSNIQDNSILHVTHDGPYTPGGLALVIGDDVTVGHGAILHAATIGNHALIGMGAVVLDGAVVGEHAFIAAGAVVAPGKRVEPGTLWRGNPARYARDLNDTEREQLAYSAHHYVRLKNSYLGEEEE